MANPWGLNGTYTPEQAQAALANARKNPLIDPRTQGQTISRQNSWLVNGVHIPNGQVSYTTIGGSGGGGSVLGNTDIAAQEQRPDNPGIRRVAISTYGASIPISTGKRAIVGNIIWASSAYPRMIGTYDYYVKVALNVLPLDCCEDATDVNQCPKPDPGGCDADKEGLCTDVYREIKSCVNYNTGKYVIFDCERNSFGGWNCNGIEGNIDTQLMFAGFITNSEDGGVAQCDICERIGVFDNARECIEGIQEQECGGVGVG